MNARGSLAVLGVVIASMVNVATADVVLPRLSWAVLIALAFAYLLLGTLGLAWVERHGTSRQLWFYFAGALMIALGVLVVGRGWTSIIVLSLVCQAALHMAPRPLALFVGTCTCFALLSLVLREKPLAAMLHAGTVFLAAALFVLLFSRTLASQHRLREEAERLTHRLRAYADEVAVLTAANEQNRIARELHDGVGHHLTVAHIQLEAALSVLHSDTDRTRTALLQAKAQTREGLNEVRRGLLVLRGAEPSRPLLAAVETFARACRDGGLQANVAVHGTTRTLSPPVEHALCRVAQEAITNVQRHAKASRVEVELDYRRDDRIRIRICDNGVGAEPLVAGFGLRGLRERAELIGGSLTVESVRDRGLSVQVEVPG